MFAPAAKSSGCITCIEQKRPKVKGRASCVVCTAHTPCFAYELCAIIQARCEGVAEPGIPRASARLLPTPPPPITAIATRQMQVPVVALPALVRPFSPLEVFLSPLSFFLSRLLSLSFFLACCLFLAHSLAKWRWLIDTHGETSRCKQAKSMCRTQLCVGFIVYLTTAGKV